MTKFKIGDVVLTNGKCSNLIDEEYSYGWPHEFFPIGSVCRILLIEKNVRDEAESVKLQLICMSEKVRRSNYSDGIFWVVPSEIEHTFNRDVNQDSRRVK